MIAQQLSIFDTALPAPLPVTPYGDLPGHRASETSAAGARAIQPKVGSLQARVVLALHEMPGLTHAGLDRLLHTEASRAARPRCTELKNCGLVEQDGLCLEASGVQVATWKLTEAGERLAKELLRC